MKRLYKYKYLYIFLVLIAIIGLVSGYIYFDIQPQNIKQESIELINIKNELNSSINNIPKRIKFISKTLIYSFFIIPQLYNIFETFYKPFQIGFVFNLLKNHSLKLSLIYNLTYNLIPLIIYLILIRISISISINIISYIIFKENKKINIIKKLLKKYVLISIFILLYEFIIIIFSNNINAYLMTLIT